MVTEPEREPGGPKEGLEPIEEGDARWPWWAWALVAALLVYAFLAGPFDVFSH